MQEEILVVCTLLVVIWVVYLLGSRLCGIHLSRHIEIVPMSFLASRAQKVYEGKRLMEVPT